MGELREIRIPIIYHTPESLTLEGLGIESNDLSSLDVRDGIFFNIDAVVPRTTDDRTSIYSGGDSFISPLTIDEVLKLIHAK